MTTFDIKGFQERLKSARKAKKISKVDVAEAIGIGYTTYRRYENDPENVPMQVRELYKLCKLYNVSADELLGLK